MLVRQNGPVQNSILIVDDNPDDALLISRAFEKAGVNRHLQTVTNGLDAMAYLRGEPPFLDREVFPLPALVLLDIRMPLIDGFELLRQIRHAPEFADLCVVMLTSSDSIRDVNQAYKLGADSFMVKPIDFMNAAELVRYVASVQKEHEAHTLSRRSKASQGAQAEIAG